MSGPRHPNVRNLPQSLRAKVYAKTGGYCWYCGVAISAKPPAYRQLFQVDHMTPAKRDGSHELDNLVPACIACNLDKRGCTLAEYRFRRHVAATDGAIIGPDNAIWLAAYLKRHGIDIATEAASFLFWGEQREAIAA